jgi:hypothetical protein
MRTEAELAAVSNKFYKLWADNGLTIREVVQLAIDWADAHQPSPWISVDERLPEEQLNESGYKGYSEQVFVRFERVYDHGQKDVDYDTSNYMNVTKTWLNHNKHYTYYTDRITHWMPIPEV